MTDSPDTAAALRAALERAGSDKFLNNAAQALLPLLEPGEYFLEAARTKAHGFDGAAFVTNRHILVQRSEAGPESEFEYFDLDSLTNVITRNEGDTWSLIAESFSMWKVWGGFAPRAAQRLQFAAQWALTTGREARVAATRDAHSAALFDAWRAQLAAAPTGETDKKAHADKLKELLSETNWVLS